MTSLHEKIRQGSRLEELTEELADYAVSWLAQHILIMDKKYSEPLTKCGVE